MSTIIKNENLVEMMELDKAKSINLKYFNVYTLISIVLGILSIIFFFAYPLYSEVIDENIVNYSFFY